MSDRIAAFSIHPDRQLRPYHRSVWYAWREDGGGSEAAAICHLEPP